ncbi:MAG: transcription termination factor Rho [bacterium]
MARTKLLTVNTSEDTEIQEKKSLSKPGKKPTIKSIKDEIKVEKKVKPVKELVKKAIVEKVLIEEKTIANQDIKPVEINKEVVQEKVSSNQIEEKNTTVEKTRSGFEGQVIKHVSNEMKRPFNNDRNRPMRNHENGNSNQFGKKPFDNKYQQKGNSNVQNNRSMPPQFNNASNNGSNVSKSVPQFTPYKITDLEGKTVAELREIASKMNLEGVGEMNKHDLIIFILAAATQNQGNNILVEGILEIMADGTHGVLRSMKLLPSENDVYVSLSQIRRFNMRMGDFVVGLARLPKDNERYLSLLRVDSINATKAEEATNRPYFERMTPIFPNKIMNLETEPETLSTRLIDLLSPIGYGQRGMVVAPPKAGKTWLLKDIAKGISQNHPNAHLMVVLIAERPEEVTDMARFVKGEVFAANFDESAEVQVKVAELSLERAKRMVESGHDVVILLDSITRLARAYNVVMPTSGRTLSGGMDPIALYPPKRFFGAARNFENGKSLTIIATALVDTGSKMDDVVFEEFKGTGNMELHLDRALSERRVFPAINIKESGTRNEDLLLGKENLAKIWSIRRLIDEMKTIDAVSAIADRLKKTKTNQSFLDTIHEII